MTTRDNADTISLADATKLGLIDWFGEHDPDDPHALAGASLRAPAPTDVGDPHERVGATLSDGTLADDAEGPDGCGHDWPAWAGPCADCSPGRGPEPDELRDLAEQMPEPTPAEAELIGRLVARARVRQLAGALAFGLLFGLATVAVRVGDPGSASVLLLGCAAMLDGGVAW